MWCDIIMKMVKISTIKLTACREYVALYEREDYDRRFAYTLSTIYDKTILNLIIIIKHNGLLGKNCKNKNYSR